MTAIFISKDKDEFRAYESALADVSESTGIAVRDVLDKNRAPEATECECPFEREENGAKDCMPNVTQSVVHGRLMDFPNGDLLLVVLNGGLLTKKEPLREKPNEIAEFQKFADEISHILDAAELQRKETYVFVHLGNAGNAANVSEIEKLLQDSNKKKGSFTYIQCLSSKRAELFSLDPGTIHLPTSCSAVEELHGRIELSGDVEGLLTAFSLRCSICPVGESDACQWVRLWVEGVEQSLKNALTNLGQAKNWLAGQGQRLSKESPNRTAIELGVRLLDYLSSSESVPPKELGDGLKDVGLRNIAIAIGKVLQKGR